MIPIHGPLKEKLLTLSGTYLADLPLLDQGGMAPSSNFQPNMKIFVINHKMRQALDIPLWGKVMMTASHTDDPSLLEHI